MDEIFIVIQKTLRCLREYSDIVYAFSAVIVCLFKDIRALVIYIVRTLFDFVCWPFRLIAKRVRAERDFSDFYRDFLSIPSGARFLLSMIGERRERYIDETKIFDCEALEFLVYKGWLRRAYGNIYEIDERVFILVCRIMGTDKKRKKRK